MSVLSRYVLAMVARPMLATIAIALIALLAERTLRVVDLVVGWRGSLLVVVEMLGYLVPHYMGLAIPAAFFLGVLLTFDRLSKEAELAAMFASGAGIARLLRPLMLAAVILMVVTTVLASYLQPFGRYAYRAASYALTNASFYTLLQPGIFTTLGGTTYMAEGLSDEKTQMTRVFVHHAQDGGGGATVTAVSGQVARPGPVAPIVLHLQDGVQQLVPGPPPPEAAAAEAAGSEVTLRFRTFETEFGGDSGMFRPRGDDERELTLPELWQARNEPPPNIKPSEITAELHARVIRIVSLPLLPLLAIPLALGRIRGQRSYGLVIGLAVLIAYHQILQFGEALVDNGDVSAWLGLWLPFAGFAAISLWLFVRAATGVPDPRGAPWLDRQLDRLTDVMIRSRRAALGGR